MGGEIGVDSLFIPAADILTILEGLFGKASKLNLVLCPSTILILDWLFVCLFVVLWRMDLLSDLLPPWAWLRLRLTDPSFVPHLPPRKVRTIQAPYDGENIPIWPGSQWKDGQHHEPQMIQFPSRPWICRLSARKSGDGREVERIMERRELSELKPVLVERIPNETRGYKSWPEANRVHFFRLYHPAPSSVRNFWLCSPFLNTEELL